MGVEVKYEVGGFKCRKLMVEEEGRNVAIPDAQRSESLCEFDDSLLCMELKLDVLS